MIYLVEDDESIRELVVYTLNSQGLDAQGFERPSLFWKAMEKEQPSLVLLDIMLPEIRRDSKCADRSGSFSDVPIIMLTARGEERDSCRGFELGVDEYISKTVQSEDFGCASECNLKKEEEQRLLKILIDAGVIVIDKAAHLVKIDDVTD